MGAPVYLIETSCVATNKSCKIWWALKFLMTVFDGPPKVLKKIVKHLQSTLVDTLWPIPNSIS